MGKSAWSTGLRRALTLWARLDIVAALALCAAVLTWIAFR